MRYYTEKDYVDEDWNGGTTTLTMVEKVLYSPVMELSVRPITIGRAQDCDVVLRDPCISAYHAQIFRIKGEYCILDLGSTNGTLVNGQSLGQVPQFLKPGDLIRISACRLLFQKSCHAPGRPSQKTELVSRRHFDPKAKRDCVRVPRPVARWLRELAAERESSART